jgi:MFS family permease
VLGIGASLLIGGVILDQIEARRLVWLPWTGDLASWRQLMVLAGLPGFVLLPFLLLIPEPARQYRSGALPIPDVFRQLMVNNGAVLRVCLVKAVLSIGDNGLTAWTPTLLQRNYGLSPLAAGSILALSVSLSGAVASVTGGTVSDWFVRRWGLRSRVVLLLGCYTLTVIGGLAVFFAGTDLQAATALGVWVFGSTAGYVIGHIVMQESVPNEMRATTIALSMTTTALIGIALGPTLVALVAEHALGGEKALQPAMGMVSLCAALLALPMIWPPIRAGISALRSHAAQ